MEASNQIIKVLDNLAQKFGVGIDWSSKKVLPYIEKICGKYINYEIATSGLWIILGIMIIVLGICLTKYLTKRIRGDKYFLITQYEEIYPRVLAYCGTVTIILLGVLMVMCQIYDITVCLTFPEKIIFDELQSLISPKQ